MTLAPSLFGKSLRQAAAHSSRISFAGLVAREYQVPDERRRRRSWCARPSLGTRLSAIGVLSMLLAVPLARAQESKEMAITFDDLPFAYARNLTLAEQRQAVDRILAVLEKHQVTATVFVIGGSVTPDNRVLLDAVVRAGHVVGSHSFSHPDLGSVTADDYMVDIEKGAAAITPWLKGTHYFRYPYLQQGNTVEKRDAVLRWIASHGIVVAPVTIDNNDFLYNRRLVDARAEGRAIDVREAYLDHMMKQAAYYDAKGRARMGRAVKQVLLLHMNYLNSLYLDEVLLRFRQDGWSFIPFEEALRDDVYRLKYEYVGMQGAGHLDALEPPTR